MSFAKSFCTALTACTLLGGAALAQERLRPVEPMSLELRPTAAGVEVGFDKSLSGLMVVAASMSPATHLIRKDLPPVLVDMQVIEFRPLDENTRYELKGWVYDYYAQFGVLDFATWKIGVSQVLKVAADKDLRADYGMDP